MFVVRLADQKYLSDDGPVGNPADAIAFNSIAEARKGAPKNAVGISEFSSRLNPLFHYPLQEIK